MCCEQSFKSAPYICLLTRQYIFLTYVYCATDITPSTLSTQPTPPIHPRPAQPVFAQLLLSLPRARKAFQVTFRRALVSLVRFMSFLLQFIPALANIIWARATHSPLSVLGQQKQVLYLLNMALFVAFASWLASICHSIALQMNRASKRQTLKSLIY